LGLLFEKKRQCFPLRHPFVVVVVVVVDEIWLFVVVWRDRCWDFDKTGEEFGERRRQFVRCNCAVVDWRWAGDGKCG
jgi:hypothetical protein